MIDKFMKTDSHNLSQLAIFVKFVNQSRVIFEIVFLTLVNCLITVTRHYLKMPSGVKGLTVL